jgi:hypothetical protein
MGTLPHKRILIVGLGALVFVLAGAIVGLIVTSGGESSGSVRKLALQPTDLPSEFVLTEEKLYSREELLAELPADSQIAEQGLKEAVHLTYESQEGVPVVDVFVYAYTDEDAAEAAHTFAGEPNADELRPVDLGRGMRGYAFPDSLVVEGIGGDGFLMTGQVEYDDGNEKSVGDSLQVQIYFMRSGSARAEVLVAGESMFVRPETVARNQYLRLERPDIVVAPQDR